MKRNLKLPKKTPSEQSNAKRTFTTIDEVGSYFFPEGRPQKGGARGKERGAKAAVNAFTEIVKSL
jgi:hypothetical protein